MNSTPRRLELRAHLDPFNKRFRFLLLGHRFDENDKKCIDIATGMVFSEAGPGVEYAPTFTCATEEAQQMMDELWRCGLRPTEGSGSAGSLAATERHLEDMRRLVFESRTKEDAKP